MKRFLATCSLAMLIVTGTSDVASAWIKPVLRPFGAPIPPSPYRLPTYSGNGIGWAWNDIKMKPGYGFNWYQYPPYFEQYRPSFRFDDEFLVSTMGLYYSKDDLSRRVQPTASLRPLIDFAPNRKWDHGTKIALQQNPGLTWFNQSSGN